MPCHLSQVPLHTYIHPEVLHTYLHDNSFTSQHRQPHPASLAFLRIIPLPVPCHFDFAHFTLHFIRPRLRVFISPNFGLHFTSNFVPSVCSLPACCLGDGKRILQQLAKDQEKANWLRIDISLWKRELSTRIRKI